MDPATKMRLDMALVERGLAATRSQARDFILRGAVTVGGMVAEKPATAVSGCDEIRLAGDVAGRVSRGAVKLKAALELFSFDAAGRVALDIGASTGGFTQVLLERGAARVYAVDVGRGQLHSSLTTDERVVAFEATDARSLTRHHVAEQVGAIVVDVSFISATKVLPVALALAAEDCWLVVLVKPQFEAGREAVGKGGVVRDPADRQRALEHVRDWIGTQSGWRVVGSMLSPIAGGSGNAEFLLGAVHGG